MGDDETSIEMEWFRRVQSLKWFAKCLSYRARTRQNANTLLNEEDLMGEPWDEEVSYIALQQTQGVIRYSLTDIVGMIQSSLESREEFSVVHSVPTHPYTNQPWSLGELYMVQGWLRQQNVQIRNVPLVVCVWIRTPYVIQTLSTENSSPYFMNEYQAMKAKYNYMESSTDRDSDMMELRFVARSLGIRMHHIQWVELELLPVKVWNTIIRPFLLFWKHPLSEWIVEHERRVDVRTIQWKKDLVDRLITVGCYSINRNRQRIFRRKHRIGTVGIR